MTKFRTDIESTQEISPPNLGNGDSNVLIELLYRGKVFPIDKSDLPYKIGRDNDNSDLFIPATVASRKHCAICIEDGRLGLKDSSTNGTFVQIGQAKEICVKGEFYPILGKGAIKLGEPVGSGEKNIIYFKCN